MRVAEVARLAGVAPSAVRWYEAAGVLPPARRGVNGYREYSEEDLARLRLVVSLRHLGLEPAQAGRLARVCLEHGEVDAGLAPLMASQRAAIARRRADLDRLESELLDVEATLAAVDQLGRRRADTGGGGDGEAHSAIRVLFVCTGNSGRSQIAEGLLDQLGGAEFEVASAGTQPRPVSPYAIEVLAEVGIDWRGARSRSVEPFLDQRFDYVITVCDRARETCPTFRGSENTLHWGLDDPAEVEGAVEERRAAFRTTRDELAIRLRPFVEIARRSARRRTARATPELGA